MNKSNQNLFIIAIGASAGGMEAIHLLFDHTPEDGVSYVIIQHLSPDHKSFMAELLAKHSKLKIYIVENDMYIEPNCVYLMPRGMNMTIKDRRLYTTERPASSPNTGIDLFFSSLAAAHGNKAIAVVLSGTGTDGTKGAAAIKKLGGYVIVQDPATAKFSGMPESVIESGNVDAILAPELMPDEIISYLNRNKLEYDFTDKISAADEAALLDILKLIQEHTPLDFQDYKRPTIIRRLVRRMAMNEIHNLTEYAVYLQKKPAEIKELTKEFLISVTSFFRDTEAFELIKEKVIPEISDNKLLVDTLKVWVVGCATGEEAYSIAMLINEHLSEIKKSLEVKIFASDIDKAALTHAAKGIYSADIIKDLSEERVKKFFVKGEDNKYRVREQIRKMIIFAEHDIIKQPPYGKMDLICCRNVLIYFNPLLQRKILSTLHFSLNIGGYLLLGPSESLGDLKEFFQEADKRWKLYKNIEMVNNIRDTNYVTPSLSSSSISNPIASKNVKKSSFSENIDRALLDETGYEAGVCVDQDCKILQSFGNYEKYLLPKLFNFNLMEMLHEDLSIVASTALKKAIAKGKKIITRDVKISNNGSNLCVRVMAKPILVETSSMNPISLILFGEDETVEMDEEHEVFNKAVHADRFLENLKTELSETKQKLNDAYESLEMSHDNISSFNEELISSNEEMQSTNEELQSVNEELQTVNNEYQLKIKELAELNDDLNNYFKGSINGQLYVDNNLIVKKFTPSAVLQVNLKDTDIGRPLSDLSTKIKFANLIDDITEVISTSQQKEREIQTKDDKWYQMVIVPYIREMNNEKDGAIITFNDITTLKTAQEKLIKLNSDHETFIYSVAHDLNNPIASITGLSDVLNRIIVPENKEVRQIATHINVAIGKLKKIVDELSVITKLESNREDPEIFSLDDLMDEVKSSLIDALQESKAQVHTEFDVATLQLPKKNMRSILLNLISNAIKYSSPDREPEIQVKTKKSNGLTILSVQDNGLGMDMSKKDEIFNIFKRLHHHVEGTGIGLYLVKKMVNNAGGEIEVESEVGKGSTFKIYFRD